MPNRNQESQLTPAEWDSFWTDLYCAVHFTPFDDYSEGLFGVIDDLIDDARDVLPVFSLGKLLGIEADASTFEIDHYDNGARIFWIDDCLAAEPYLSLVFDTFDQIGLFLEYPNLEKIASIMDLDKEIEMSTWLNTPTMTPRQLCTTIEQLSDAVSMFSIMSWDLTIKEISNTDFTDLGDLVQDIKHCAYYVVEPPYLLDREIRRFFPIAEIGCSMSSLVNLVLDKPKA